MKLKISMTTEPIEFSNIGSDGFGYRAPIELNKLSNSKIGKISV